LYAGSFEIVVKGRLSPTLSAAIEGFELSRCDQGISHLVGCGGAIHTPTESGACLQSLDQDADDSSHLVSPEDRLRVAMVRQ
jgi:hypothetical protein